MRSFVSIRFVQGPRGAVLGSSQICTNAQFADGAVDRCSGDEFRGQIPQQHAERALFGVVA